MRRARKYLVKPIVKKRLGHDLLLPGPPRSRIRGHPSSCEPPLFLDYRRKNSAHVEYSKLLRERYRQIDMEAKKQTRPLLRLRRLSEAAAAAEAEAMDVHRTIQAAAAAVAESKKGENVTATRVFATVEAKNTVAAETTKDNNDAKRTKDAVFLSDMIVGHGTNEAKAALVLGFDFEPLPSHKKTPTKKSTRMVDSVKSLPTGAVSKTTPPQKERVKAAAKSKTKGPPPPSVSTTSGTAASNIIRSKDAATGDTKTTVAANAASSAKTATTTKKWSSAATARTSANADSIETTAADVSTTTRKLDKLTGGDYVETYTTPGKRWTLTQAAPANRSDVLTTSSCDDKYGGRREGSKVLSTWKPTRGPFSNPIVFPPAKLSASLSPNKRAEFMKREARLQRAWRRVIQRISKTVPMPMRWPSNMKQPPALFFEQTKTFELRRHLRHQQHTAAAAIATTTSSNLTGKSLQYTEPRRNLTQTLRYRQLKRQPIISEFFEKFYSKYGKPPFKLCVNSFG